MFLNVCDELSNRMQEDFIVITRALEKEHIDEIISVSEKYKESTYTTQSSYQSLTLSSQNNLCVRRPKVRR